ncbi:hypothetical protein OOZ15_15515 [Galbibacter sp. EGI 63066]|uniref:hypothetical protein n=1 Tax=Galbibacter sp. EGI 63066 TaxID=2993559 RepID=UPI0022494ED4|nr:hypothetical protein [Galbibacter sp. EGI 63066]MCX2681361.1 hypothetical protein [Galbibacter sp. EGI 63066]
MKHSFFTIAVLVLLSIFACKNEPKKENLESIDEILKEDVLADAPAVECYLYVNQKDSIQLMIEKEDNSITGSLAYKFYEKDKSFGTVEGVVKGDTLLLDYNFMAEGMRSMRKIIFLKKGDGYIPGYGETEEKNGVVVFKEGAEIDFYEDQVLKQVSCE